MNNTSGFLKKNLQYSNKKTPILEQDEMVFDLQTTQE
jgi:hypothetical protein